MTQKSSKDHHLNDKNSNQPGEEKKYFSHSIAMSFNDL